MAKIDPRLVELLKKYGEDNTAVWDCHGTWVAFHAAVERMAAKARITFDKPEMIVNDPEKKTVVVCVSATMGTDVSEWSFGEVSPANNKNSYPYAMAEKRAKDRVALKLLGMSGLVYSEEEADDFKAARPATSTAPEPDTEPHAPPKSSAALKRANSWESLRNELEQDMVDVRSLVTLEEVKNHYRARAKSEGWTAAWLSALKNEFDTYEEHIMERNALEEVEVEQEIARTFPGARVIDDSIRNHPINAG